MYMCVSEGRLGVGMREGVQAVTQPLATFTNPPLARTPPSLTSRILT